MSVEDDPSSKPAYERPHAERPATALSTEAEIHEIRDPYAAFRHQPYRFYALGNFIAMTGRQMLSVGIGWEIYQRTHSATALGLVGLMLAIPIIVFAIPAGQIADRFQRKHILLITQILAVFTSLGLAALSLHNVEIPSYPILISASNGLEKIASVFEKSANVHFDPTIPLIFLLLFLTGTVRAFGGAAHGAILPNLVPTHALSNGVTWRTSLFEIASAVGPAIGGFVIAQLGFLYVCGIDILCTLIFFCFLLPIKGEQKQLAKEQLDFKSLFSGLRFVWNKKIILATLTLDLFAVLLGGATALLPIFADQILHVGAIGLGWLRAAPSLGAVIMGFLIAYLPPMKQAGKTLLWSVAGFGLATALFGISQWFWLSMIMLCLTGAFDTVSVVVRHTLVQLLTPDQMRGRVSAVNNVFIGSSNELGAFESGITAAMFGPLISVIGGGIGTIVVVILVIIIWPEIQKIGPLDGGKQS